MVKVFLWPGLEVAKKVSSWSVAPSKCRQGGRPNNAQATSKPGPKRFGLAKTKFFDGDAVAPHRAHMSSKERSP